MLSEIKNNVSGGVFEVDLIQAVGSDFHPVSIDGDTFTTRAST